MATVTKIASSRRFWASKSARAPERALRHLPYQELSGVTLRQGQLVAFPSVMEYRLDGLVLVDGTHRHLRTVNLPLFDPYYRICSNRNLPPHQHWWWAAATAEQLLVEMPAEVKADIMAKTGEWPVDEAYAAANMIREHGEKP